MTQTRNFPQTTSLTYTPERSNSFWRPDARQQRQQIQWPSITRSRLLSRSWQRPILCDPTFDKERRKKDSGMQRVHATSQRFKCKVGMCFEGGMSCWSKPQEHGGVLCGRTASCGSHCRRGPVSCEVHHLSMNMHRTFNESIP